MVDYVRAAAETAAEIHRSQGPGDVLIFLPGQGEIEAATQMLGEEARRLRGDERMVVLPFYANLPADQQMKGARTPHYT